MKRYLCYIKSHCEAPDFEVEVEAQNKTEAVNKILQQCLGLEFDEVEKNTINIEEIFNEN